MYDNNLFELCKVFIVVVETKQQKDSTDDRMTDNPELQKWL
jgi:hypothetical protein